MGERPYLWAELYSFSELRRGFVRDEADPEERLEWSSSDFRVARAEFSPGGGRGHGIFYGATHDVFSWMPRRVQWHDAASGQLICDLESFTIQAGRRILSPSLNTMAPEAMAMHRRLSTSVTPSVPQALDRIWRRNTWLPTVREYAWRVLTGTAFAAASMIGRPLVERWQCNCNFCDVDVLDTMDHRMFECDLAKCAWAWARQVLDAASLHYEGTAAGMWLYGGSTSIHDERVVTTLRGAFFEALPAVQRRLGAGEEAVVATTLGQMIRARMLSEIQRDIFYVSDVFERSYDARDRKMGRPEDRGAVLAVWRGLVQHASARDGGLVGVLPPVDNDEETPGGVRTH